MATTTTRIDLAAMTLALTGDSGPSPITFAHAFLQAVAADLEMLEEVLQTAEEPDPNNVMRNAAMFAFRLGLRVKFAERVIADLAAASRAGSKGAA